LHICKIKPEFIYPFTSAITVCGSVVQFFALLILTETEKTGDLLYIMNVIVYIIVGELYDLPGISNTAKVYGVLYILFKFLKLIKQTKSLCLTFLFFCILYLISLYINLHPEYLIALLNFNP
jgi:hypothetical protein